MIRARTRNPDLDPTGRVPQHQLGKIEISGTKYQLLRLGAWSSTVGYLPGNVVTSGGSDYVCILANVSQAPPNATYWLLFDETQYWLRSDRVWAPNVPILNPGRGQYKDATLTVPAGFANSVHASFTLVSGGVLDLTDPLNPTVTDRGVYHVSVDIDTSSGWAANAKLGCGIVFGVSPFNGAYEESRADSAGDMTALSVAAMEIMNATQAFSIWLFNDDVIDHDVTVDPIVVVRVYQF